MKRSTPFWTLFVILTLVRLSGAGTFHVPKDEPIATIRIPDKWQVREEEEFVEATPPDGACHLLVWTAEGTKVAESTDEAFRYIKRNGTITVRPDAAVKRETSEFNGHDMTTVSLDALEKDQPITIRCHAVPVADSKWILLIVWGAQVGQDKHRQEISKTLETLEAS